MGNRHDVRCIRRTIQDDWYYREKNRSIYIYAWGNFLLSAVKHFIHIRFLHQFIASVREFPLSCRENTSSYYIYNVDPNFPRSDTYISSRQRFRSKNNRRRSLKNRSPSKKKKKKKRKEQIMKLSAAAQTNESASSSYSTLYIV